MAVSAMGQSPMRSIDIGEKPIGITEETISGNDFELFLKCSNGPMIRNDCPDTDMSRKSCLVVRA
jgi:hypothetical protein